VPTGAWTGLTWIAVPGGHSPAVPKASAGGGSATLEGWSKGYVEFVWSSSKRTLTPWASVDGLSWIAGAKLDTSAWAADFKTFDKDNPKDHDSCDFRSNDFQEGPAASLLKGVVICTGGCPQMFWTVEAAWTSTDGVSWIPVGDPPGWSISGGSSGFVSYDATKALGHIWTSSDGSTWTQGQLPAVAGGSWVNSPVAIAGGYVLPGVVVIKKGSEPDDPAGGDGGPRYGCAGGVGSGSTLYQAALWWSPDGKTWTRDALGGATTSSYHLLDMTVTRIDDHTVEAYASFDDNSYEWVSKNGRTWTHLKGDPDFGVVEGRDRGLVIGATGSSSVSYFDSNSKLVTLKQAGTQPFDRWYWVLGPTGLLVATQDCSRFWLGVPTGSSAPSPTPTIAPTPQATPSLTPAPTASASDSTTP
jgi:hypothetical protein